MIYLKNIINYNKMNIKLRLDTEYNFKKSKNVYQGESFKD
jgi:hypothetical protein